MKTGSKIVFGIVAGIILLIGGCVGSIFLSTAGIQKAAEATLTDLNVGKVEQVYSSSAMTKKFTLEEFKSAMGIGAKLDISTVTKQGWTGRGFQDGQKYITGNFTFSNGHEQVLTFWYINTDGELKLVGITSGKPETPSSSKSSE